MRKLRIKQYGFTNEELKALDVIASQVGTIEIDQRRDVPRYIVATGATDIVMPLAWFVLSLAGASAGIILKSFLEAIGSELGKNFVNHIKTKDERIDWRRLDPQQRRAPRHPAAVVWRVKPTVFAIIRIDESTNAGVSTLSETLKRVEELATTLESERDKGLPNTVVEVLFDTKTGKWIVEHHSSAWLSGYSV